MKKHFSLVLLALAMSFSTISWSQEIPTPTPIKSQPRKVKKSSIPKQRWAVSTAYLLQSSPLQELASLQLSEFWYAQKNRVWGSNNLGMGLAVGFAYEYNLSPLIFFRFNTQVESTGWISWIIDTGFGVRVPMVPKKHFFIIDVAFATQQSGGKLKKLSNAPDRLPSSLDVYYGLFGFKGRIAMEFGLSKSFFITPYLSYSAYPWLAKNITAQLFLNGKNNGILADSLQIGLEFGAKF